jgi:tetratricopeptide (TPR) repeat protein
MNALLMLVAATTAPAATTPAPAQGTRFERCVMLAQKDPGKALAEAGAWRLQGGGVLARQCEGLAYVTQKRWRPAATAFEAAARDADRAQDGRAATLWVQAGNAALAGGDALSGRRFFDAALARGTLSGDAAGEAHLDRGRALAALGTLKDARTDIDQAIRLVPADPLVWLLSATLARRMNDLPRARADIQQAATRSPDDASVAYEAGTIAMLSNREDAAMTAWRAAHDMAPDSASGRAAADAMKAMKPAPARP